MEIFYTTQPNASKLSTIVDGSFTFKCLCKNFFLGIISNYWNTTKLLALSWQSLLYCNKFSCSKLLVIFNQYWSNILFSEEEEEEMRLRVKSNWLTSWGKKVFLQGTNNFIFTVKYIYYYSLYYTWTSLKIIIQICQLRLYDLDIYTKDSDDPYHCASSTTTWFWPM